MKEEKWDFDRFDELFETCEKYDDIKDALVSCDEIASEDHCENAYERFVCVTKALEEKGYELKNL